MESEKLASKEKLGEKLDVKEVVWLELVEGEEVVDWMKSWRKWR